MPHVDVFKDMNEPQREAIAHLEGPLLVVAGAGSGKTRVITHRIANIIQHGTRADRVLAITFTNKAAGEMKERIERLLGLKTPWITTFHSAGLRLLKLETARLGFVQPFTVLDEDDRKRMFKRVLAEMKLDHREVDARQLAWQISTWKNQLTKPVDIVATTEIEQLAKQAWEVYQRFCKEDCQVDFDDLLMLPVQLMEGDPELRAKYQARFPYVLIDEYQDTNHAQYRLVQLLGSHGNVCATGDPDQAIYGWRGADLQNILRFEQDFPGCRTVLLEQNYRSTKTILRAAQGVVENNANRKQKTIRTDNSEGKSITLLVVDDEVDESLGIAAACERMRNQGRKLADVAVFYRTNVQSRPLEDGLRRRGLPYRIVGGTRFYDRMEVKDLLAYLKLLINPRDSVSLDRIANVPKRGVGEKTMQALTDLCHEQGVGFHEVLMTDELVERIAVGRNANPIKGLVRIWRLLRVLPQENPAACVKGVLDLTGLEDHYRHQEDSENGLERIANLREVGTAAEQYHQANPDGGLAGFLDQVALVTSADERHGDDTDQVTLMTLHAAKGLEFPVVFITGCEQGVLPLERFGQSTDYEEERRLMYVGITRAKQELYLSRAVFRQQYGQTNRNDPSMFLREIPADCFQTKDASTRRAEADAPDGTSGPRARRSDRQRAQGGGRGGDRRTRDKPSLAGLPLMRGSDLPRSGGKPASRPLPDGDVPEILASDAFRPEDRVVHTTLGRGRVVGCKGPENDRRVVIAFDRGDWKELLLAFCVGKLAKDEGGGDF